MRPKQIASLLTIVLSVCIVVPAQQKLPSPTIFVFHTDEFWLFGSLTSDERTVWSEAVSAYASTVSKKDLVFDDSLPGMTKALARAFADRCGSRSFSRFNS